MKKPGVLERALRVGERRETLHKRHRREPLEAAARAIEYRVGWYHGYMAARRDMRSGSARRATMSHTCHWPGCPKEVPPAMWGCKTHWFTLPKRLRDRIWATYRPGQEIDKRPSETYLDAAKAVQNWISEQYPGVGRAHNGEAPR